MASSKTTPSIALFFSLNLLFFSLITSCATCSHPRTRPRPPDYGGSPGSGGNPSSGGSPGSGGNPSSGGSPGSGGVPGSGSSPGSGGAPESGSPGTGGNPGSGSNPGSGGGSPGSSGNPGTGSPGTGGGGGPGGRGTCPRDALKIGVCARVLTLINATIGTPPVTPCCTLIQGLVDLEAAICLCTAIRASILGLNINLPINLSLLLNICRRNSPRGFQCP